jgi:hypothetical protein
MDTLKITLQQGLQILGFVVTLAGIYFGLKNDIQNAQIRTEAAIKELDLIRSNDNKIMDMQFKALQLQVTHLEQQVEYFQKTRK